MILRMRQERIARGWTQGHVGAQVGVTLAHIHDIEVGRRRPSYDVLVKLEALFGLTHGELFAPVPSETGAGEEDTQ